jgi:hypothetical protein
MMHLLTFVIDNLIFLDERDGTDMLLAGSLYKVGIRYVDFLFLAF